MSTRKERFAALTKELTAERHRVLDEVLGLIERGGNPNEIAVLCDELKEGIDTPEEPSR